MGGRGIYYEPPALKSLPAYQEELTLVSKGEGYGPEYQVREGYDAPECILPLEAATSGWRYMGDGYSKYLMKRFNPRNWRFSLHYRSTDKRGLVFFMADTRCNEHIAVYLAKGRIVLSIMFGAYRVRLKSTIGTSDGEWHNVVFERKGNTTQLMIDGSIEGQSLLFADSNVFASHMPLYIGGLQSVPRGFAANEINRKNLVDFSGCIRDVMVNNKPLDAQGPASGYRINVTPCYEGGTEPGMYFPYQQPGHPSAYMVAMNQYNVEYNMEVTVDIKPRSLDGIIFAVGGSTGDFCNLALVDGKVTARLRQGGETLFSKYDPATYDTSLCDGNWHSIRLIKARNILALTVDENLVLPIESGSVSNINCTTDGTLYVGGISDGTHVDGLLTNSQFVGCMRKMKMDLFPINPDTSLSMHGDITTNACPFF